METSNLLWFGFLSLFLCRNVKKRTSYDTRINLVFSWVIYSFRLRNLMCTHLELITGRKPVDMYMYIYTSQTYILDKHVLLLGMVFICAFDHILH